MGIKWADRYQDQEGRVYKITGHNLHPPYSVLHGYIDTSLHPGKPQEAILYLTDEEIGAKLAAGEWTLTGPGMAP